MSKYPLEALLRPPVELWSAAINIMLAVVAFLAPWALMMTPDVAYACGLLLVLLAFRRGRQGFWILEYQHNLRRLPDYRLSAANIPVSRRKVFLGRGFQWTQTHTQRLHDTMRPEAARYLQMSALYRWARRKEVEWEHTWLLLRVAAGLNRRVWWNPLLPLPPVGGKAALHGVETNEHDVWWDLTERVGHAIVIGTTRVGKTRLAEILITQDIRRGDIVIVIDPKGDPDLLRRVYAEAKRAGREDELYIFHLGYPHLSARYNAVGNFSRMTEVATRTTNPLPTEGNAAAFKEFAWRFVNIIARSLVALGQRPTYNTIRRYVNDIEPLLLQYGRTWLRQAGAAQMVQAGISNWEQRLADLERSIDEKTLPFALRGRSRAAIAMLRLIKEAQLYDPVLDGLKSAFEYDKTYFDKIVSSLGPLLEKLCSGHVAELLSPDYDNVDDPRPIFDWMQVIRRRGIVYIGLDALSEPEVAAAVGNSMFADLVSVAGDLYKNGRGDGIPGEHNKDMPPISLHADEFNELIGEEFIPLVNKAGGALYQVTAYTQTWSDIEARIGSKAKAGQIIGNFNSLVMLRVKELATAELLTKQLRKVEVYTLSPVSTANDSSVPGTGVEFTSTNEDSISATEVSLISESDVLELPKGQAFVVNDGGRIWKVRFPLPTKEDDPQMPESIAMLAEKMASKYSTGESWWVGAPRASSSVEMEISLPIETRL